MRLISGWGSGTARSKGAGPATPVTRGYGDKVMQENFEVVEPQVWHGMSVSVFDDVVGWRQTWVDQSGSYWAFQGGLVDGNPSFGTPVPVDAEHLYKRMVFTDIQADRFHWRWESSPDHGGMDRQLGTRLPPPNLTFEP